MDIASRRSPWLLSLLISCLIGCLLGSGCIGCMEKKEPPVDPSAEMPRRGGSFYIAQIAPSNLDPARMDDAYESAIVNQIYDGLLEFDSNFNMLPCVASSWQISRDGLTYSFDLKNGVRFHDGSEVHADDFVFAWSRVFRMDPGQTVLAREYLGHIKGATAYARGETDHIEGVEALGPYRLRITLERPYASFLAVLASELARVVPRAYVEENGNDILNREPIGCGPFRLAKWMNGDRLVLTRFDDYHGSAAYLDTLVYETPGGAVREFAVDEFLAGRLSAVELTSGRLDDVRSVPGVVVHQRQELSLSFLGFNLEKPPFNDLRLRQAFAHAIDLDQLTSMNEGGRVMPTGILPPGFPGYSPGKKQLEYDPELARALLAEAGHPGGRGLPTIIHGIANRAASERALIEGISQQVAQVGFDLKPVFMDWDPFFDGLVHGRFNSFSLSWVADLPDPDSFLYPLFHTDGAANYSFYSNPAVDEWLTSGRLGRTSELRIEIYRKAELAILEDAPIVPISFTMATIAVRPEVRGFSVSPMGAGNLPMHLVWLAPTASSIEANVSSPDSPAGLPPINTTPKGAR